MPIRSRTNLYRGINAHLHSRLQNEAGGWEVFHGKHISDLAEAIDAQLPPGYLVDPEKSLQIREYHPVTGERISVKPRKPRPDLTIYNTNPYAVRAQPTSSSASTPTLLLPASDAIEDDDEIYLRALVIREVGTDGDLGEAVTWIELLSPTNKPPGVGFLQYSEKRRVVLHSGINLVEIDYLHESRPVIARLPSYPDGEAQAYPYTVIVTDPRPSLPEGQMKVYGFSVDTPMPIADIPLADTEFITLDFGAVYNRTFASLGSYSYRVDYAREPERFETYHEADQQRIRVRMTTTQDDTPLNNP